MGSETPIVVVNDICKTFEIRGRPPVHALRHVTNHVDKGEVLVVIGPSGSGKSTFMRALTGLEPLDAGSIVIARVELTESRTALNRVRRGAGMGVGGTDTNSDGSDEREARGKTGDLRPPRPPHHPSHAFSQHTTSSSAGDSSQRGRWRHTHVYSSTTPQGACLRPRRRATQAA